MAKLSLSLWHGTQNIQQQNLLKCTTHNIIRSIFHVDFTERAPARITHYILIIHRFYAFLCSCCCRSSSSFLLLDFVVVIVVLFIEACTEHRTKTKCFYEPIFRRKAFLFDSHKVFHKKGTHTQALPLPRLLPTMLASKLYLLLSCKRKPFFRAF